MPEQVLLALMTVALTWEFDHLAVLLGAGFLGLLRPSEIRALRFNDFLTPRRLMSRSSKPLLITIRAPTMRRVTARRAYTRIDELGFIDFVDAYIGEDPSDQFVFNGTYATFRFAFQALAREVGLPTAGPIALSWGSLRPGGATWMLQSTDNPELVRFRGRWANRRMLEIYVQEVGACTMLPSLSADVRERVARLASAAPAILAIAASRNRM